MDGTGVNNRRLVIYVLYSNKKNDDLCEGSLRKGVKFVISENKSFAKEGLNRIKNIYLNSLLLKNCI